MNNKYKLIVIVLIIIIITTTSFLYYFKQLEIDEAKVKPIDLDKFGIAEIYPTKQGGREWLIDMNDPKRSEDTFFTGNDTITRQEDGSWRSNADQIKINIDTPKGKDEWKNIEMTGYAKVVSVFSNDMSNSDEEGNGNDLNWLARGGRHTNDSPCEGTSLIGTIHADGTAGWKKEIWHTGGYTDEKGTQKVTDSIIGKWIGWKVVMYNINNDSTVKMESHIDDNNNGTWKKVIDLTDDGGWYATSSDEEFASANCKKPKDYVVINSGSIVSFRADNIVWDFKNLSIREIDPPK